MATIELLPMRYCEWDECDGKGWYITVLLHEGGRVEMMACADHVYEFLSNEG